MKKNLITLLIITGLVAFIVFKFQKEDKYRKEILSLTQEIQDIDKVNQLIEKEKDSLELLIFINEEDKKQLIKTVSYYKQKRNEVPSIVIDYSERKLDSIISNHTHTRN